MAVKFKPRSSKEETVQNSTKINKQYNFNCNFVSILKNSRTKLSFLRSFAYNSRTFQGKIEIKDFSRTKVKNQDFSRLYEP